MFKARDISIRNKLILMQVFTSIVVLGIFIGVFIVTDIKDYKMRKVNTELSIAHVVSLNSVPIMQFNDEEAGAQILSELQNGAPDIVHAVIIDSSGKIFSSYTRKNADSLVLSKFADVEGAEFRDRSLFVSDDIITKADQDTKGKTWGKVVLQVELSELEAIKKSRYEMAAILMIGAIAFSFLIAFIVQRYISKRLLFLVNTMKQVSNSGDYSKPIYDEGKDEISTLMKVYNRMMQQIDESQHKKDEFIGIASHELKTPLTSIKGYLDLLNMTEDRQPNKQFTEKALANVIKLEQLIKDLLDVSKIQSGQLQLNIREFDIDALINESIASFQIMAHKHKIIMQSSLHGEMISADRQRIEQVMINLLSNAIKYSPEAEEVIVASKIRNDNLIIQVRDFGIGIPQNETSEIFERFYRTKDSSIHISGFGLGLYICRDIITRHNGKIWVEKESKGTSFYFSLPMLTNLKKQTP